MIIMIALWLTRYGIWLVYNRNQYDTDATTFSPAGRLFQVIEILYTYVV
jgi:hypothetical protein